MGSCYQTWLAVAKLLAVTKLLAVVKPVELLPNLASRCQVVRFPNSLAPVDIQIHVSWGTRLLPSC